MKKFLNVLGAVGAVFFSIVLTIVLICYVLLLNVRHVVSKDGITDILNDVNVVEFIKGVDDGVVWDDFSGMTEELNLTEEQFEEILNSEALKEELGNVTNKIIESAFSGEKVTISKDELIGVIDLVIDEYNKVADVKITKEERDTVVAEINDEVINDINESLAEINFEESVDQDTKSLLSAVDFILFGSATMALAVAIVVIIGLIALCRFSYYKWMPYVGVSSLLTCLFVVLVGLALMIVPFSGEAEMLEPVVKSLYTNFYISGGILFVIYAVLIILGRVLKKHHDNQILEIVEN